MIKKETIRFSALCILLATIGACDGGSSGGTSATYSCTLPCLDSTPLLDTTSVSSASGGTVKVTFTLKGDITNVNNVVVILSPTDAYSATPPAGGDVVMAPTQATNTLDILVNSGAATGTYYPSIAITVNSPSNSGNLYYLNPIASSTRYSYGEMIGTTQSVTLTNFTIPTLQVVP